MHRPSGEAADTPETTVPGILLHAERTAPDRPAVILPDGPIAFADLAVRVRRFAGHLAGLGVGRGDRVAVVLSQRPETAIAHVAIYKLGAVALPLSVLFGPDAVEYRLADSAAAAVITDAGHRDMVEDLRQKQGII